MSDVDDDLGTETATEDAPSGADARQRVMALDVGDRRIGVALSDELGFTAQPLLTMHRKDVREDLRTIVRLIRKHGVTDVVIGMPVHASGAMSAQAAKTQRFAEQLSERRPGLKLHLLDERWTTAEAHEILDCSRPSPRGKSDRKARSAVVDQIAAVLLLEAFLSRGAPRLLPDLPDILE